MAASSKLMALMKTLLGATRDGSVQWREMGGGSSYQIDLARSKTSILIDAGANAGYSVTLEDREGVLELAFFDMSDPAYEFIDDLYEAARRNARRVDDVIDRMIQEVEAGRPSK